MMIRSLIRDLPLMLTRGRDDAEVTSVTDDSRNVEPGALFVARAGGAVDGRRFVDDAVARGAAAVAACGDAAVPGAVAALAIDPDADPVRLVGVLAERCLGAPSAALHLVGVTGTNGKTTTATLAQQLFAAADRRCGLIGTVTVDDGRTRQPATLTTPPAGAVSGLLRRMVDHGCGAAVMEVSSHALDQGRVEALAFAAAVFTNLSGDHLDYHGSMDRYRAAKALLFRGLPPSALAVVNADDPAAEAMLDSCAARALRCRVAPAGASGLDRARVDEGTAQAVVLDGRIDGARLLLAGPWGEIEATVPLAGRHNAMNVLQAVAIAHDGGVPATALPGALAHCAAPPGRLEPVTVPGVPFAVLVDYAHTDDALDNVLRAVRPLVPSGGRLHVIFGCGGDRDRSKRPRMAEVACRYADAVVVTSDNPRTEDPDSIVEEILAGVPADRRDRVHAEVDRAAAIHHAIDDARRDDVVLIAGKGHEDYQIIGTQRRSFDDRLVARAAMTARATTTPTSGRSAS